MKKDYTPKSGKGPTFTLYGSEFHCAPMIRAELVLKFTDLVEAKEDPENPGQVVQELAGGFREVLDAIEELFAAAINDPAEYATWMTMRSSNETIIPIGVLVEIAMDLTNEYSSDLAGDARPTIASSDAGSNRQSRRAASKVGASRTASKTYSRSEPATTGP